MINNILSEAVECIFARQPEQLGLGRAVLCAELSIDYDTFEPMLADEFVTD